MSTATRPRTPRVYTVELRSAYIPGTITRAAGFPDHAQQGEILVTAPTKADALARLAQFGMHLNPRIVRLPMGDAFNAVLDSGLLAEDGAVVVYRAAVRDTPVVRMGPDTVAPAPAGHWRVYDRGGPQGGPQHARGGAFLQRDADGALFPKRTDRDPATPITGWVAPTAEEVDR